MEDTAQGNIHHNGRENAQHTFKINVSGFELVLNINLCHFSKTWKQKPQSNPLS